MVPFESSRRDLTSYRGPGAWGSQKGVVLRGQRCEMMKNDGIGHILAHNSGPWARGETRMGPFETTHQDLASYGGPTAWGLKKGEF